MSERSIAKPALFMYGGLSIVLAGVAAFWLHRSAVENEAFDTVAKIVAVVNDDGPFAARGLLGSEAYFASEQWRKSLGFFDHPFVFDDVVFSHATRNPAVEAGRMNVFVARGRLGPAGAALEIGLSGPQLVYWKLRSFSRDSIDEARRASVCAAYDSDGFSGGDEFYLEPPWHRFPSAERFSEVWLDPEQRAYMQAFAKRWSRLPEIERERYAELNPPSGEWSDWYDADVAVWAEDCEANI